MCRDCLGICSEPTSSVAVVIEEGVIFRDSERWVAEEKGKVLYPFLWKQNLQLTGTESEKIDFW